MTTAGDSRTARYGLGFAPDGLYLAQEPAEQRPARRRRRRPADLARTRSGVAHRGDHRVGRSGRPTCARPVPERA
nr:hypothetical protein [Angustibacter aerolatus]